MKQFLLNSLLFLLVLNLFSNCKKTSKPDQITTYANNDSIQFYAPPKSMYGNVSSVAFSSIVIDNKNNKWMSTSNGSGIFRFDGFNWTHYDSTNMPVDINRYLISSLFIDGNGTIYMYLLPFEYDNTVVSTLLEFKNETWQSFALPFIPYGMAVDKWTSHIYFTTISDTVYKFNEGGSVSDPASYSIITLGESFHYLAITVSHDSLLAIFSLHEPFWSPGNAASGFIISTEKGDITVHVYPDTGSLDLNGVFGSDGKSIYMLCGQTNSTIVGSSTSLIINDGVYWKTIPMNLPSFYPWLDNLKNSNDGLLWITYGYSGIASYENQQFRYHDLSDSKPYSHIADFAFDSDNVKWLACWEGLVRYNIQ